jgi:parallel beta-helix repeat protein
MVFPFLAAAGLVFAGSAGANRPAPPKLPPHVIGNANPACGATLTVSTTLTGNLDCSGYAGTALTLDAGVTLNLGHHTLTVDSGETGVYSDADKAAVTGGQISGGDEQVDFEDSSHDVASLLTLTGGDEGVEMDYETAAKIMSNTITGESGEGLYMEYSASDLVQGNAITNAGSDGIETDEDAHDEFTLNHVTNSSDYNYYDEYSDLDEFIGNTSTGGTDGFYLYEDEYGAVIAKNNVESEASDAGFYLYYDYNDETYSAPYTVISGNKANDNGDYGFEDYASYNATYTGNSANDNVYGFNLEYPGRNTITGNSAASNTDEGFRLSENYEYYNVLTFSSNKASSNGDYGFHADYGAPGKLNTGSLNVPADCYDVVCGAGVTTTPKPLAAPLHDPSAPPPPPGG